MKGKNKYSKILRSRELRKDATQAEQVLWRYLRDRKFLAYKFRRQYVIRGFIVDFYCPQGKLAIELDGNVHDKQKEYDAERQEIIENSGVRVIRFKNNQVLLNIKKVLKAIKKQLANPSPSRAYWRL